MYMEEQMLDKKGINPKLKVNCSQKYQKRVKEKSKKYLRSVLYSGSSKVSMQCQASNNLGIGTDLNTTLSLSMD